MRFARTLRLRCQFGEGKPNPFRRPNPNYQPENAPPAVEAFLWRAYKAMSARLRALQARGTRTADNISRAERAALSDLRARADLITKPADKNLGLTIMDAGDYHAAQLAEVADAHTYSDVTDRLTEVVNAATRTLERLVREYKSRCLLTHQLAGFLLQGLDHQTPPSLYIMPKLHKMGSLSDRPLKSRPIAACHSWVTTYASQWLAAKLNALLPHYPTILRDRNQFARELHGMRVSAAAWLCTFDVVSLYPNIPHSGCVAACTAAMGKACLPPAQRRMLADFLEFVLKNNVVEVQGRYYLQEYGGAMGTNCLPPAAQLYLAVQWEGPLQLQLGPTFPEFLRRFLDDGFFVFEGSEQELLALFSSLNSLLPNIRITYTYSQHQVEFLDLVVYKGPSWPVTTGSNTVPLLTRTHQKALNRYLYIPYHSFHPPGTFTSFIYAELLRFVQTNSDEVWYTCMVRKFRARLLRRGYPPALIDRLARRVDYAERRAAFLSPPAPSSGDDGGDTTVLALPYARLVPELRPQRLLYLAYISGGPELWKHVQTRPIVAFQRTKSIGSHLVKAHH